MVFASHWTALLSAVFQLPATPFGDDDGGADGGDDGGDDGDDDGGDYMTMIRAAQKARVATRVLRGRSLVAATAL